MTAGKPLSSREMRMAVAGAAVVALCLLYAWVVDPALRRWETLTTTAAEQGAEVLKLRHALAIRAQAQKLFESLPEELHDSGSNEKTMAGLLKELERIFQPTGLYVTSIKPLPSDDRGFYKQFGVVIDANGDIDTIVRFLHELALSPQMLAATRVDLAAHEREKNTLRATFVVTRILLADEPNM